jgi:hypothetical protein
VALQGIGALLAGSLAQLTSPATAMTLMAIASLAVTLTLHVLERRAARRPGGVSSADPTEYRPAPR